MWTAPPNKLQGSTSLPVLLPLTQPKLSIYCVYLQSNGPRNFLNWESSWKFQLAASSHVLIVSCKIRTSTQHITISNLGYSVFYSSQHMWTNSLSLVGWIMDRSIEIDNRQTAKYQWFSFVYSLPLYPVSMLISSLIKFFLSWLNMAYSNK